MARKCTQPLARILLACALGALLAGAPRVHAQFGGGGPGGGGMPGGAAPGAVAKPKFRDAIHEFDGLTLNREKGEKLVAGVRVVGNRTISGPVIDKQLQTRKDRFYDYEAVLSDVRRLREMGAFDRVSFDIQESDAGVLVTFKVHERPVITKVIFFGVDGMTNRELAGRAGLNPGDPLSPFSIESASRRLMDYYREEGFNRVAITTEYDTPGAKGQDNGLADGTVIFRINEGPLERIKKINISGSTIVSEARLKKVIRSRDQRFGLTRYFGNVANLQKLDRDVDILQTYYHNLGFLTATVGRSISYDESGKWLTVDFVVNEGPRFSIGDIQIVGNQYITEASLRARQELKAGDYFNGTMMQVDVGEIIYGYGELGFMYAEVTPKTIIRDESGTVDLVYQIIEGDRWRVGEIHVLIDGDPNLIKEPTILNLMELSEGDLLDRRKLETDRRRLGATPILESDPSIAETPDIKVVPRQELR